MVRKITGIDNLASSVIERLGNLVEIYLMGGYARGMDTRIVDLILIGSINREELDDVVVKTERYMDRKIRPFILSKKEYEELLEKGSLGSFMKLWDSAEHEDAV